MTGRADDRVPALADGRHILDENFTLRRPNRLLHRRARSSPRKQLRRRYLDFSTRKGCYLAKLNDFKIQVFPLYLINLEVHVTDRYNDVTKHRVEMCNLDRPNTG